jgi:hypothetical protein
MRKTTILTGLTTVAAAAAIAAPSAMAQAPAPPSPSPSPTPTPNPTVSPAQPATPSQAGATPSVHIRNCTISKSRNAGGFAWASCSIVGSDVPARGVRLTYKTNMKTFNPGTPGPWRRSSGTVGFGGGDSILALKFGFKGKTVAQVRKSLKVTITDPDGSVTITSGTAVAAPAASGS